jgi:uncharacterized PurR-regulated membrane protein YhhQ (DUF165 family)
MAAYEAEESGPYRLRPMPEGAWPSRTRSSSLRDKIVSGFVAIGRLVLPVLLLLTAFAAMYLYRNESAPILAERLAPWLTLNHLILPLAFFSLQLTNRRYGPGYAFAQLIAGVVLAIAAVVAAVSLQSPVVTVDFSPTARMAGTLVGAFFAAGFISILVFDGARGRRWWPAPLLSMWAAAIVYAGLFYAGAYAGIDTLWINKMAICAGVMAGVGVALLVPYWMLRRMVPPLSGYGGY